LRCSSRTTFFEYLGSNLNPRICDIASAPYFVHSIDRGFACFRVFDCVFLHLSAGFYHSDVDRLNVCVRNATGAYANYRD